MKYSFCLYDLDIARLRRDKAEVRLLQGINLTEVFYMPIKVILILSMFGRPMTVELLGST